MALYLTSECFFHQFSCVFFPKDIFNKYFSGVGIESRREQGAASPNIMCAIVNLQVIFLLDFLPNVIATT